MRLDESMLCRVTDGRRSFVRRVSPMPDALPCLVYRFALPQVSGRWWPCHGEGTSLLVHPPPSHTDDYAPVEGGRLCRTRRGRTESERGEACGPGRHMASSQAFVLADTRYLETMYTAGRHRYGSAETHIQIDGSALYIRRRFAMLPKRLTSFSSPLYPPDPPCSCRDRHGRGGTFQPCQPGLFGPPG